MRVTSWAANIPFQVQPGGGAVTIPGDYAGYPELGLQVNSWYWTSEKLPVQKGPPQSLDNSGAQFAISDQCVLSQAPPVCGKGIETYEIATVTAQKTGTNKCLVTIDEKPPYTDAVTPSCCAPPCQAWRTSAAGLGGNEQPTAVAARMTPIVEGLRNWLADTHPA